MEPPPDLGGYAYDLCLHFVAYRPAELDEPNICPQLGTDLLNVRNQPLASRNLTTLFFEVEKALQSTYKFNTGYGAKDVGGGPKTRRDNDAHVNAQTSSGGTPLPLCQLGPELLFVCRFTRCSKLWAGCPHVRSTGTCRQRGGNVVGSVRVEGRYCRLLPNPRHRP